MRLYHRWMESNPEFFSRIDACGGWPLGKKYVSFFHDIGIERRCEFGDTHLRNEWWTTIATADEYYWWKISTEYKAVIAAEIRNKFVNQIQGMASSLEVSA